MSTEEPSHPCPVCEAPAAVRVAKIGDYKDVDCVRCGEFMVSGTAATLLARMTETSGGDISRFPALG